MRFNVWMGILLLMIVTSCREDRFGGDKTTTGIEPEVLVESSIKGRVIDENQEAVIDAVVTVDGENQLTDENGFFYFPEGEYNKNGEYVTVNKNGYFLGAKVINPGLGATSFTEVKLLSMDLTGSFNTSSGGTITTADEAKVIFTENAIVDASGNTYNGTVDVFVKWIDPSSEDIAAEMPGDLRAIDSDDETVQLATYGMLAVELRGNSGQELNLADGKTAELSFPLPADLAGSAPNTIPLWSFNETTGYWEQEGTATLQDGKYVGDVSHFSFWNCDAPFPLVVLSGNIQDEGGEDIVYLSLSITVDGIGTRYGYIDSDGNFEGKVPKNEILNLVVTDNCGGEIFSQAFGPYTEDTDIGSIIVDAVSVSTISGRLVNCDGNAVTNGYAYINMGPFSFQEAVNENGEFSISTIFCQEEDITVKGYDLDELLQSDPITITTSGDQELGDITVCDEITEFIRVTVVDPAYEEFIFNDLFASFDGNFYVGTTTEDSTFVSLQLDLDELQTGTVDVISSEFYSFLVGSPNGLYASCGGGCDGATAEVSINEGAGGRVKGVATISLDVNGPVGDPIDLTIEWDMTTN